MVIALLQLLPSISVTERVPTILFPLIVVLAASAVKDLFEDRKRKHSDDEENSRLVNKWNGEWVDLRWRDVKAGDVLKVLENHHFPADLLLLASSDSTGICYVETKSLDGETNLKHKVAHKDTLQLYTAHAGALAELKCEKPNAQIYQFSAVLTLAGGPEVPMCPEQFLLRGSSLKNTE